MKPSLQKKMTHKYNPTFCININPAILANLEQSSTPKPKMTTAPPINRFKKINFQRTKHISNTSKISTITNTNTTTTPQTSKYKSMLDKLNNNINILKTQYKESLKQSKFQLEKIEQVKICNISYKNAHIKNESDSKKLQVGREQYEINKLIKEKFQKNKMQTMKTNKTMVSYLHLKEKENLDKHKQNLLKNQMIKKRILFETKQKNENDLEKSKKILKIENEQKKLMIQKRNQIDAERRDGYEVYSLRKIKGELEDKIKIQNSINAKLFKQYVHSFNNFLNEEGKELIIA